MTASCRPHVFAVLHVDVGGYQSAELDQGKSVLS